MDLLQVLQKSIGADQNELRQAQELLENYAKSNWGEFLVALSTVLNNPQVNGYVRMAAGLQLKNQVTSKDEANKIRLQQQWMSLPEDVRNTVKSNVMHGLSMPEQTSATCQCVAYIAAIELPNNQWGDLLPNLTTGASNPAENMKISCLETIGYICAELPSDYLKHHSNQILTAIVNNMGNETPSNQVRLCAANALLNSLEFTRANFNTENERHYIMQVVCEATQCQDLRVRVAALQCLVKIMSLYYQYMEHYMEKALFAITLEAMKSDHPESSLQGIEFWSTLCDEEIGLATEAVEAAEQGRPPVNTSRFFAKGALHILCPVLLQVLCQQDEDADDDEWNPAQAACVCLSLLSCCVRDDIIPQVMPFITENIRNSNWHYREAAIAAFAALLEGPSETTLVPLVQQALPIILSLMEDPVLIVRDTTAFALNKICEQVASVLLDNDVLQAVLAVFMKALNSEPRVAVNICWALNALSESVNEEACNREDVSENPRTNRFSPYFDQLVHQLLACTERPDANVGNLRSAAYEALMELIKNSAQDNYATVQKTTIVMLERLNRVLGTDGQADQNVADLQSLLCSTLQAVLRKMSQEDAPKIADHIMRAIVHMLEYGIKIGSMNDDALVVASSLADALGPNFLQYMPTFQPYLLQSLKCVDNSLLCSVALGVVSDFSHAFGEAFAPYCNDIMTALLEILTSEVTPQNAKTEVLSVFGDIAMNIGPHFKPYLAHVLQTLCVAIMAPVVRDSPDAIEYCNQLWEGVLHAFTGIIQSIKAEETPSGPELELLQQNVTPICEFLVRVSDHYLELPDAIIFKMAGLIGDMLSVFGNMLRPLTTYPNMQAMLARGKRSKSSKTRNMIQYCNKEIKRLGITTNGMPHMEAFQNALQQGTALINCK